jgi:hypothetical protein
MEKCVTSNRRAFMGLTSTCDPQGDGSEGRFQNTFREKHRRQISKRTKVQPENLEKVSVIQRINSQIAGNVATMAAGGVRDAHQKTRFDSPAISNSVVLKVAG